MRQFSPAIEQQDLVLLMRLSAIEIAFLEMHFLVRFRRFRNFLDCLCDLRGRSVKCDIRLSHNADAPSPIVYNGDSADLVFLHQLQALVQCVFRATRHRNAGHEIRNLDRISVLPGSDHAAAQVTICHYPFKEGNVQWTRFKFTAVTGVTIRCDSVESHDPAQLRESRGAR